MSTRRGARRPIDVPADVKAALEAGAQSVNHMEQMAMDFGNLLLVVLPEAGCRAEELRVPRFLDRMRAGALVAHEELGEDLPRLASAWSSDTARGWAAFAVPLATQSLEEQIQMVRPYADDPHFAVREWAWLAIRPTVVAEPLTAVALLTPWTSDPSAYIRRFSCEVLRPRGVWSAHITPFKAAPEAALSVLEPLVSDEHPYVRDSVANWLNDAAKSQPEWVTENCSRWKRIHGDTVAYVCRRATRSLRGAPAGTA